MADSFRMDTSGKNSYREDQLETAMELFGENTKSKAIIQAIDFSKQMHKNLEVALTHEDMTEELAEILSTRQFKLTYEHELHTSLDRGDGQ